ncbi:endosomal/lysosomal potassium channel TMEM175-like [Anneissia japonica]|uniref:endosomal/lysosomal potassium channel TMEM175-like n=1 Tax=Anneissia japonica TaxID=1529436 RepID=UPI001425594A|nr:endosomal/lysosomal potassium channel TMEM175-like [Anneissia japonica]
MTSVNTDVSTGGGKGNPAFEMNENIEESNLEPEEPLREAKVVEMQFHRFLSPNRLCTFSDAVFTIIVTIMIVPLSSSVDDYDPDVKVWQSFEDDVYNFIIYGITFLIVIKIWEEHAIIFSTMRNIGDTVIVINVIMLLIVSLVPFFSTLLGEFPMEPLAIVLQGSCFLIIVILEALILVVAFSRPKMIESEFLTSTEKPTIQVRYCIMFTLQAACAILAISVATASPETSWAFLVLMLFCGLLCDIIIAICSCFRRPNGFDHAYQSCISYLVTKRIREHLPKERVHNFSDGVFAIVATLIILDVTTSVVPSSESLTADLRTTLKGDSELLLSYAATYITIGMIWYIHYTIFNHLVVSVSRGMNIFNKLTLLCVGMYPFNFKLVSLYRHSTFGRNENVAVQISCALLFLSTVSLLCTWGVAHVNGCARKLEQSQQFFFIRTIIILSIYPVVSLITFLCGFQRGIFSAVIFEIIQICLPVVFLIIRFIIDRYHKHKNHRTMNVASDDVKTDFSNHKDSSSKLEPEMNKV